MTKGLGLQPPLSSKAGFRVEQPQLKASDSGLTDDDGSRD